MPPNWDKSQGCPNCGEAFASVCYTTNWGKLYRFLCGSKVDPERNEIREYCSGIVESLSFWDVKEKE